jgi:hypothetical protein
VPPACRRSARSAASSAAAALRPVERRDEDDVPLVALDRLDVLDEELLEGVVALFPDADIGVDLRIAVALALELLQEKLALIGSWSPRRATGRDTPP